jgi:hypothetical protein
MSLAVHNDTAWKSGLAGAVPAALCHAAAAVFLFAFVRRVFASVPAAWAAIAVALLNPNAIYLGVVPMTEPFFGAAFGAMLWSLAAGRPAIAGIAGCAATLIRYEGWFILPFFAAAFLLRMGWRAAITFAAIAAVGPLYWLAHNRWLDLDPLLFYRGPYSAKAIQAGRPYPGSGDWHVAWVYFRETVFLIAGRPLAWLGVAGAVVCALRRQWIPLLAVLPPMFYLISLHGEGTPIFVPTLWPSSYYNTRYGLAAIPLLAIGVGALVATMPKRLRSAGTAALVLLCAGVWAGSSKDSWVAWKEPQVNSGPRRAFTRHAAAYLRENCRSGAILTGFGDLAGIFREAGIPLRATIHEGNGIDWLAQTHRPELFLRAEWAIARAGDPVDKAIRSLPAGGRSYRLVWNIVVPRTPEIRIYRLDSTGVGPPPSLVERLDR